MTSRRTLAHLTDVCNSDLSHQEKRRACVLVLHLVGGIKRDEGIGIAPDRKRQPELRSEGIRAAIKPAAPKGTRLEAQEQGGPGVLL